MLTVMRSENQEVQEEIKRGHCRRRGEGRWRGDENKTWPREAESRGWCQTAEKGRNAEVLEKRSRQKCG